MGERGKGRVEGGLKKIQGGRYLNLRGDLKIFFLGGDLESKWIAGTPKSTTVEIQQYFADHLTKRAI